jgi:farnesyl-diphosphate farnesyltransferase
MTDVGAHPSAASCGTDGLEAELAYQEHILQGVSRTFALTIPQLPEGLRTVVGNAYLLCRIADTIEDCPALDIQDKRRFYRMFLDALSGTGPPEALASELAPRLEGHALDAECGLAAHAPDVIRVTHSFGPEQQQAILRCVRVMAEGMEHFQTVGSAQGLHDEQELDAYCYYVAGVVGEMLTDLFCAHSRSVAERREALSALAVSFGQGLQMTNILKDMWDDRQRNACWLPQSAFAAEGSALSGLEPGRANAEFEAGLTRLIAVTRGHLENAMTYTLYIPKSEQGIRRFCLWAIGMAVLTLRNIYRNRAFTSGSEVKISRRSVRATMLFTQLAGGSDTLLRMTFNLLARGLPKTSLETG